VAVGIVNFVFTLLTAVAISVAARTVGALMVSSLMVIPVISAMQLARSYRGMIGWAVNFAVLCTLIGLTASYYLGLRPGATIVMTGVVCLLLVLGFNRARGALRKRQRRMTA
jgi:zinc transport system permease protein